jgi:RHS repeat-associated protein
MPDEPAPTRSGLAEPSQLDSGIAAASTRSDATGFTVAAPQLTLPKGGGAIRGIGEKFDNNPVTGTGTASIPIATSPGRSGFGPALSLSYDSGSGNSAYGFGWSLNTPHFSRRTDRGLPQYHDDAESDTFIPSGSEGLVRVLTPNGKPDVDTTTAPGYTIHRYRPRIDTTFARIERWTRSSDSDTHWRSYSRDNIVTIYGKDDDSRISDPDTPSRVFTWLICETRDDRGNAIIYDYKPDNTDGVETAAAHQQTRNTNPNPKARTTNRYLKRIRYGNRAPLLNDDGTRPTNLTDGQINAAGWMFELVVDYGEHDQDTPTETRAWEYRTHDAFSNRRSGFEVRTTRLCQRFLMFHHIPATPAGEGYDGLVRSTDLTHTAAPTGYAYLTAATQRGYTRNTDGSYVIRDMPPVEFRYSEAVVGSQIHDLDPESLQNLPYGIDGTNYQIIDLHGEGAAGILSRTAGGWYYKPNLSPLQHDSAAIFGANHSLASIPNATPAARFADLAGDGRLDLIDPDAAVSGFYRHDDGQGWEPLRRFQTYPNTSLDDPNVRMLDLVGDGLADLMITVDDAIVWQRSLGEDGFGPASRIGNRLDENDGPRVLFAQNDETIHLADMTGDGLTDLVRIRSRGEVCYWPNLGYGRFGPKITMDNGPHLDEPDQYDPRRLVLADIDGTGTIDLIYIHRDGLRLYFNESGNRLSDPTTLNAFPTVSNATTVAAHDLHGNGTACLVWSSPLPADNGHQLRYVDLMAAPEPDRKGSIKPHLLTRIDNNLGAETTITYAPSTKFYLQDKRDGRPWITSLPFPVHVVERVETYDAISKNRSLATYIYHDGFFDHEEREYRGFGMVEQFDTEHITALTGAETPAANEMPEHSVPPVHTKTWFHTGIYLGRDHISNFYAGLLKDGSAGQYYREPGLGDDEAAALLLPATVLPTGLTLDEEREACRALKGSILRQEVYTDDAPPNASPVQALRASTPYTITEQNFDVRVLQHTGPNRHAAFLTHPREAITYHYDRSPDDPRTQHALTLDVDEYGNVLKEAAIGYGRRHTDRALPTDQDRNKQRLIHITAAENILTNAILEPTTYRTPMPADSRTYELRKPTQDVSPDGPTLLHRYDAVRAMVLQAGDNKHDINYEDLEFRGAQTNPPQPDMYFRRLIEHTRTLYRSDDLIKLLPLNTLESLALPGETYRLAFTSGLLTETYKRPRPGQGPETLLPNNPADVLGSRTGDGGGYLLSKTAKDDNRFPSNDPNDYWWIPSGRIFYKSDELAEARQHFFLPRRYENPFGHNSFVDYDTNDLLIAETRDALDNRVTAAVNDYRVLQPRLISDPNQNQTEVAFDTLGMVVGTAIIGKNGAAEGDSLTGFIIDPTAAQLHDFALAPRETFGSASQATAVARQLLGGASIRVVYDLNRFRRTRADNPTDNTKWEPAFAATIVRETHLSALAGQQLSKLQINFSYSDGFGREIQRKVQAEPGPLTEGGAVVNPRWVGSGWIIYNNKGKPVRQYEPFFSATHGFEFAAVTGVSPVLFYDPVDRLVATLYPNHTYDKAVFDPWQHTTYDTNDTSAPRNNETGDPRTDPDIGGYVAAYFAHLAATNPARPWQTWYAQRAAGGLGPIEQSAAIRAADHADTPATTYFDTLGRPFMTRSRNRVVCDGHALHGTEDNFYSRTDLDIEGNQRTVCDAVNQAGDQLGRIVMHYNYNMLGARIQQSSMEAGARWILNDVTGKPIRIWDSRGHNFTTSYDELRRPNARTVRGTTPDSDPRTAAGDVMIEKLEYGEPPSTASAADKQRAIARNLRTRLYRHCDPAGVVTNAALDANDTPVEAFDFKGNLLSSTRRFTVNYTDLPNWQGAPQLEDESFVARTRYDALNRPIQTVVPHSSKARAKRNITQPTFNDANLLERVDVWLELNDDPTALIDPSSTSPSRAGVTNIDYDAKGQRQHIDYKNDTSTHYSYDPDTFRLTGLYTRRGAAYTEDCDNPLQPPPDTIAAPPNPPPGKPCGVQNLHYTYDPAGNITHIRDDAQQTLFFRNQRVEPSNDYIYDALYRLIQATGREHLGQLAGAPRPPTPPDPFNTFHAGLAHPGDSAAMGTYTEQYVYDAVGNFTTMQHKGSQPVNAGWTLPYDYSEPSLIETGTAGTLLKASNRLSSTGLSATGPVAQYLYDPHGNTTFMPHLGAGGNDPNLGWDYADRLRQVDRDLGAFYVYDASGQRVRKIWRKSAGLTEERIYLGGFEIFRSYPGSITNSDAALERETLHILDGQRRIALVETRTLGNDAAPRQLIRYQHTNHLGSTTVELDANAKILSYEEYSPYGSSTYQAMATETPKRYRYTGKERDEESGLCYHGARYLAPWLGRWISPDPAGLVDSTNLYLYVNDNPISKTDSTGRWEELLPGGPGVERSGPGAKGQTSSSDSKPLNEVDYASLPPAKEGEIGPPRPPAPTSSSPTPARREPVPPPQREWRQGHEPTPEEAAAKERSDILTLSMDPGEYALKYPDWGMIYGAVYGLVAPFKAAAAKREATQGTHIRPDLSGDLSVGVGQIALIALPEPGPATVNRAEEIAVDFYNVASKSTQNTLSSPRRPVTISTVTREGVTVVNVNNQRVYEEFLRATEHGSVVLKEGEFVGSPPIPKDEIPHPEWESKVVHAETQGERELSIIFGLTGKGVASSFPNPGCHFCVPWLATKGIAHSNPKPGL